MLTSREGSSKTVLFAQVNRFSLTNDALYSHFPPHLADSHLETIRTFVVIRNNPLYFLAALFGVFLYYGYKPFLKRDMLTEKMIKTPVFFHLSGWLVRRKARGINNLAAVFQTQGLFNGKVAGKPLIVYTDNTILNKINGADPELARSPILGLEKRLYREAGTICVAARHVAQSLSDDYGIDASKVKVVYIGANAPPPPPSPPDRYQSRHILFVGIDWERKGGPELVRAFERALVKFPDARLSIVGCNPAVSHPRIAILGRVPKEEVSRLMSISSIFCMPSYVEPFGIAPVEASLARLPVVGTATGGILESVVPEKTGILVEPGNVEQLQAALERLLASPELCAAMGAAGYEWAQQFRWPHVTGQIVKAFQS
jgi:glycosyltransferase involved in cell wall biosynthesis